MTNSLDLNIATHALDLAPFGVCITGANNQFIYGNKTLYTIFNLGEEKNQSTKTTPALVIEAINSNEPYFEIAETSAESKRTIKCWAHDKQPGNGTNIYFFLDVTEKQKLYSQKTILEDELSRLNTRDLQTGLPNKIALLQSLEPLISRSRRYNNPLTVIHLEVECDNGTSNDDAIVKISHMLRDQMRWADIVGRLDDNKFLLVLPETPEDAANILVEKLNGKISELIEKGLNVRTYFGLASWNAGDDARLLLKRSAQKANELRTASAA